MRLATMVAPRAPKLNLDRKVDVVAASPRTMCYVRRDGPTKALAPRAVCGAR